MKPKNFIVFSDCIPVKGFNRSIICDTMNNKYFFIPNGLHDILIGYNGKTIEDVKKGFEHKFDDIIDEYFDFLTENKIIFFNAKPELFPKIVPQWSSPSPITNVIIDFDEIMHDFDNLIHQFEELKCSHIQLRFYKKVSLNYITSIAELLDEAKSRVVSIDFILPFNDDFNIEKLNDLLNSNARIHSIIIFDSPSNIAHEPLRKSMGYLLEVEKSIINEKHCGIINTEYFYSNIKLYSESQSHNTCLNRKISIDKDGNIKNCPSMLETFGNIKDTSLEEALKHPNFKKYWNINKDQIEVCKDCEFRHICTDCRAFIEDPENQYSKPLKCGYDPYTNVWEDWSVNPLKIKAIEFYELQEI